MSITYEKLCTMPGRYGNGLFFRSLLRSDFLIIYRL